MNVRIPARITESIATYPLLFLFFLFLGWVAVYLFLPVESQRDILAPQGEGDRISFGDKVIVSQEFTPHVGLSGIHIPVGSNTYPNSPLILHVRPTLDGKDLAVVPLFSFQGESAHFRFAPLWVVPDKLFWIVEAPHVPEGSFWVYREQDTSAFIEGKAYQNKRIVKGNIGFSETWHSPRISGSKDLAPVFEDFEYASLWAGGIGIVLFILLSFVHPREKYIIIACIIIGALLHVWLGLTTPVIIDEGAYIQDVLQSSLELLPFRDFLTKGPLYLFFLWVWSFIIPNTVIAWRLFSILAWAVGGYLLWKLAIEWDLRIRSRVLAVAAFSLIPAAVALTTPLLLQTASVTVSLLGLLLTLRAIKNNSLRIAALSAAVFTIAFFVRVTAAIPACISLGMYLLLASYGYKIKFAATYIGTGLLLFALVFGAAGMTMGLQKAAVMVNMEALLISQTRQDRIATAPSDDSWIRTTTIESRLFWRAGVLLLAPLLLLPLMAVHKKKVLVSSGILMVVFYIGWNVLLNLQDTNFLLPKTFSSTVYLIVLICFGIPFVTALAALLHGAPGAAKTYWTKWQTPLFIVGWLLLTAFAYSRWGRFRQSYLTEFLPQLALLLGVGFDFLLDLWSRITPRWFSRVLLGIVLFASFVSLYQGYAVARMYPHTGTIDQQSLVQITSLIEKNVPKHEMIFTAQPVATAFADRHIMFGYSHPGWYREARFGTISETLRDLLFRKPEDITEYLKTKANFVLTETRTNEIYFEGYPDRIEILKNSFVEIESMRNEMAGDTYTLYRRR